APRSLTNVVVNVVAAGLPVVGRSGWRLAGPPASAAGFTHRASCPGTNERANRLLGGGGDSAEKLEYVTTQPVCSAFRQAPMFWKSPPLSAPTGTLTTPPKMIADTSCARTSGFGSISSLISLTRCLEPF